MISIVDILDWVGRVTAILFLLTLAYGIYAWSRGILPALIRLGNGLSRRKIAIFAKGDHLRGLESLLSDSKLFNRNNVIDISAESDFGRAEQATLFLVFWDDWQDKIDKILSLKKDGTALIVYAPSGPRSIPEDKLKELDGKRNVTLANFRGRLLNDIVVSLMTSGYQ
jgi:hypothetical protein